MKARLAAMGDENRIHPAHWKKEKDGYSAWLVRRPKLIVRGGDEAELIDALGDIAMNEMGDCEACIELTPPLPPTQETADYFEPSWFRLSCNEGFYTTGDKEPLYRDGLCPWCGAGLGGRNDVVRVIDGRLRGNLGFLWDAKPRATIVSDAFLAFFRPYLGDSLRAIACESTKRGRKAMWEIYLPGAIPYVCHRTSITADRRQCPKCGTERFGQFFAPVIKKGPLHAIALDVAKKLKRPVAIAGQPNAGEIIVSAAMAEKIRRAKLAGILLEPLVIIPPEETGSFAVTMIEKRR